MDVILQNRQRLELTGIKKVRSTEPSLIIAEIQDGQIVINGNGLSVESLDIKEGNLVAVGLVNSIKYTNNVSKSFSFKNMFK